MSNMSAFREAVLVQNLNQNQNMSKSMASPSIMPPSKPRPNPPAAPMPGRRPPAGLPGFDGCWLGRPLGGTTAMLLL